MKKILFLALLFFSVCLSGPLSGRALANSPADNQEKVKIGVSVPMAVHGWTGAVVWWAKNEIVKLSGQYKNVEFIFVTADSSAKQTADIQAMVDQNVKALVVLPVSDKPLFRVLETAHKKGIFIVAVDRISPELAHDVIVMADNDELGRLCGEFMAKTINGKGNIVIMEALPSTINTMRVEAFKKEIKKYPGIKIVDSQHVNWNPVTGQEVMEQFLKEHPNLDAIWTGDDSVLLRTMKIYKRSGRKDLKLILGLGGAKEVLKMIKDDNEPLVKGTITYPATIISDSIRIAVENVVDGKQFNQVVNIECTLVDHENAAKFYNPDSIY
ncbi:ribose ABC transporter substrate-binding protein [Deltaproteobacteria bacterium Smac51]|nr:ribose ABC transporter substrate-binding protein [Deltaproteobacteria bacterium Smac51]